MASSARNQRTTVTLAVAVTVALATVTACGSTESPTQSPPPSTSAAIPSTAPTSPAPADPTAPSAPVASLPAPAHYQPNANDSLPAVKKRAAESLEVAGTWSDGEQGLAAARKRLSAAGFDPGLASQAGPILTGDKAAVTNVTYTQYFGLLQSSASVLALVEQWRLTPAGTVEHSGTTFDVRMARGTPNWRVAAFNPAKPLPAAKTLPAQARAVLANPRIHLPDAARADVASGAVAPSVLSTLTALAHDHILDVSVIESAHPANVYGTNRRSDHFTGHAVDIGAIDGRLVIDRANRSLVALVMRQASALGPYQVGGPVDLDGGGTAFFADDTHRDHIHIGFR